MPSSPPTAPEVTSRHSTLFLIALIAAGLAGNYFKFPIFFNTDYLFGSIFAMLALQIFGFSRGVLAAAIIAGYTYVLWNHSYAIIIFTIEAAVVSWLIGRCKMKIVPADALFWIVIGMPLGYFFFHVVEQIPFSNVYFVITKEAVNGIANALIARLIFTGYSHMSRTLLISYREIVYNLLAFFVLCPALIMMAVESRSDFNETDRHIRSMLTENSQRVDQRLEIWVANRMVAIVNLAEMAASRSPGQIQPLLEQAKRSDSNFQRVALLDREATTVAFFPLVDELGRSNIGKNFADRPFIPQLKSTLKPMLSEVVLSRVAPHGPAVSVLAPVIDQGKYGGYVIGVLGIEQIREFLDKSLGSHASLYTLLDKNGNVIMSNRDDQKVMAPFVRSKGTLKRLDAGISQWVPAASPNTPLFERWLKSYYVAETAIGRVAEWKLILEQPAAPFQKKLYDHYTDKLALLFLVLLGALALAELISRRIVVTLGQLRTLSYELPARLATDGKEIVWPESGIKEANHLINNFREMADTLSSLICETRQIADEMRESRQQLQDIIDFYPDAIFVINNDKKVIVWNSAIERLSGVSRDDMLGKGYHAYTVPFYGDRRQSLLDLLDEESDDLLSKYHNVVRENETLSAEIFCPALNDGKGAFVWCAVAPLYNLKGARVGAIESIRDITERHQSQEDLKLAYSQVEMLVCERTAELYATNTALTTEIAERKQTEDALRKSEAQYHSLVETSQDLVWQCDAEGRYTFLNLAWEQVFGYELDEMLGRKFSDFQSAAYAELDLEAFNRLMDGTSTEHYETVHIGKSGNEIHLVFNALFVTDEHAEIVGVSGTAYDITQRKRMEEELRQAKAAAEAANRAKSEFLATMSHEIRTPMNGVIGMVELLQHTALTSEQHGLAESAKRAGIELVHLLNDILDLSKIEAYKIELEISDFDLRPVISDTINLLSLHAREKGVELISSIDPKVPTALKGDAGRLRQIITNLVGNAIKFTPKGSVSLHIRQDCAKKHSVTLRFLVQDSGIGIAADKLEHVFEPFTQADSSTTRKYGGTGLGLAICKRLAELMGGNIGVESTEGVGSTFWFTVVMEKQSKTSHPLPPPTSPRLEEALVPSPSGGGLGRGHGNGSLSAAIRILLTEDDPNAQKIVPKLLKSYGYQVDVAGDGKAALQALEKDDYALVLMDCMMPEMNGYQVTAVIRDPASAVRRHDIPVIALTGNAMKEDRDRCIAAGMDDHLAKPLMLPDLLAKLELWLEVTGK